MQTGAKKILQMPAPLLRAVEGGSALTGLDEDLMRPPSLDADDIDNRQATLAKTQRKAKRTCGIETPAAAPTPAESATQRSTGPKGDAPSPSFAWEQGLRARL